jgi:hypothetical protein
MMGLPEAAWVPPDELVVGVVLAAELALVAGELAVLELLLEHAVASSPSATRPTDS